MVKKISKLVVVPVDGSESSLKSLAYLHLMFGSAHNLKVCALYVLPSLPPILVEEARKNRETANQLKEIEIRNTRLAERVLEDAKQFLQEKGFAEDRIQTVYEKRKVDTASDICVFTENKQADALVLSTRGRSRLVAFFMGETANKVLEHHRYCPVWMVKGSVKKKNILIALDNSENSLRAVDHAGFMLAGTDAKVTLFHTKRSLRRFVPKEIFESAPELEELWKTKAGQEILPVLAKAKEMLLKAGVPKSNVSTKIIDGSRSIVNDILSEAHSGRDGTIVLGRHGSADVNDFRMGDVARKVLENASDMAMWIVV
ncbi:universal stress protein [Thermodesulfobacteriota bacterium]